MGVPHRPARAACQSPAARHAGNCCLRCGPARSAAHPARSCPGDPVAIAPHDDPERGVAVHVVVERLKAQADIAQHPRASGTSNCVTIPPSVITTRRKPSSFSSTYSCTRRPSGKRPYSRMFIRWSICDSPPNRGFKVLCPATQRPPWIRLRRSTMGPAQPVGVGASLDPPAIHDEVLSGNTSGCRPPPARHAGDVDGLDGLADALAAL